ncbi:MAG: portal protein [Dialister pneumosintes]
MTFDLYQAKNNVKKALLLTYKWRNVAKQNYEFVKGKQWTDGDLNAMNKAGRPAITVNRIKPMINLLCGYSAQNETEPDFLPRSEEDDRVSRVAKGITKYVFDKTNYQKVKKQAFKDSLICGMGCYWLTYEFNWAKMDGVITIKNVSPFDVFVDPESNEEDLSDANFCGRYSWETPEKLKQIYQDKEQAINTLTHQLDETELETVNAEPLWYSSDLEKIRVVQYWYKEYGTKEIYYIDGQVIDSKSPEFEMLKANGMQPTVIPNVRIRFATFCGDLLLEEGESPYEHGKFPLVIQYCSKNGWLRDNDGLEPAGIVGDLKDVQRELNKNRSQRMHIVNQQSLGVKFWHGNADEEMKRIIRTKSTVPGANIFLSQGLTFEDGLPANQSIGNLELENKASSDFYNISGITPESLSGSVGAMSGKAIDLRQSVTTVQTAEIFDNAKEAEREIVLLLWGDVGARGLIPQYFDKEKVLRITGEDGKKEFVQINPNLGQSMVEQPQFDEMGTPKMGEDGEQITKVIYDLSCFDFDIVITTSQASATARRANLYQLLEAKKSGVDIPMDIILDFMDFPEKETVKKRLQQQAEQPNIPEFKVSGTLEQLPAQALSQALQSIGVNIPPEQILQERMALRGKSVPMASQPILPPNINQ